MSAFFGLIGTLILIVGAVLFFVNKKKESKFKHTKTILIVGVVFFGIGLAIPSDTDTTAGDGEKKEQTEEDNSNEDSDSKTSEDEQEDAEKPKQEQKTEHTNKDLYVKEVSPWQNEVLEKFDSNWSKYWQEAFNGFSDGTKTEADVVFNLETLKDDHYKPLIETIKNFDIPSEFKEGEKEKIKVFKDSMVSAVNKRIEAIDEMLYMIDAPDELSPDKILSIIGEGDQFMLTGIANLVELQNDLGIEQ